MDGLFLIDKPMNMTSFDVVAHCRRRLGIKKIGHTGTLDPNATGLMIIMVGKATKLLPFIDRARKTYVAQCKTGLKTKTGDIWGEVVQTQNVPILTQEQLDHVLKSFIGDSLQLPPMVSALSIEGKRLYEYARQNIEVEREKRPITIDAIDGEITADGFNFTVTCSSGTYVRTLCEDISEKLGTLGTMSALRRVSIGDCHLSDAMDFVGLAPEKIRWLDPLKLIDLPQIEWEDPTLIYHGKRLEIDVDTTQLCITHQHQPLAIYEYDQEERNYRCVRGLW